MLAKAQQKHSLASGRGFLSPSLSSQLPWALIPAQGKWGFLGGCWAGFQHEEKTKYGHNQALRCFPLQPALWIWGLWEPSQGWLGAWVVLPCPDATWGNSRDWHRMAFPIRGHKKVTSHWCSLGHLTNTDIPLVTPSAAPLHPPGRVRPGAPGAPSHQELVPEEIPAFSSFFKSFGCKYLKLQYFLYSLSMLQGKADCSLGLPLMKVFSYLQYCMELILFGIDPRHI